MEEPIKWLLIHAAFRKPEVLIALCSVNQLATCPRNLQQSFIHLHWPEEKDSHNSILSVCTPDPEASPDLKVVIQLIITMKRKVQCAHSIALLPPLLTLPLDSKNAMFP